MLQSNDHAAAREFQMAPEFKKVWWFLACVVVIVPLLLHLTGSWRSGSSPSLSGALLTVLVGAAFGAVFVAETRRWRLRVDNTGLHRVSVLGRHTWSWDEFDTGNVRMDDRGEKFVFTRYKIVKRYFSFLYLSNEERDFLFRQCEAHWVRPEIVLQDSIEINVGSFLQRRWKRKQIWLNVKGIDITSSGRSHSYTWNEVRRVVICRRTHFHDDFRELLLDLPHGTERLVVARSKGNDYKKWSGPKSSIVARFIEEQISADKLMVCAFVGPPRSVAELDARLEWIKRMKQAMRKQSAIIVVGGFVFVTFFAYSILSKLSTSTDVIIVCFTVGCVLLISAILLIPILFVPRIVRMQFESFEAHTIKQRRLLEN